MTALGKVDTTDAIHTDEVPFGVTQAEARIAELAAMKPLDYELCREATAKALNMRISVLDKEVEARRPRNDTAEQAAPFEDVEPWHEPVNGEELLAELQATIERFCVLPAHSAPLMAAWILFTWAHDAFDISPVLAFVSPEKRCGKTTALSVIGALAPKPMHAVSISSSVLFRVVERYTPTVLIDEADTFLAGNDELRGILNGGHNRRSAYVWRSVGDDHEPRAFKVWSPKAVAMIGQLPDTLADRALMVPLRRKQADETVERFRERCAVDLLELRRKAARWSQDNIAQLREMDPKVPAELNDRAQDNARAICAIADAAGDKWPNLIRDALVGIALRADDEPRSAGALLLRDIAEIFERLGSAQIASSVLCETLWRMETSPWSDWRSGKPISPRGVAKLLRPYGITAKRDRANNIYIHSDFADAFERYLPDRVENSSTTSTSSTDHETSTKNGNEINGCGGSGTCGAYFNGGGSTFHEGEWEGEL